ncbi:Nitrogenase (molybdenum-iron)-specific transcriptional regulator NifA [Labilithrix luteola]|uniref:Nitrogenase (Molybdenum-iron)-specific transcriptional regulator NifA n=2 Tax=Labilithrix luteola TaxID=1391654 RepID=A0A0K1QFG8_9BACT|nr:Nitrogenase (molybdenum-iron)-specific transcriptional regulator NifA [Labilithrix luteola]
MPSGLLSTADENGFLAFDDRLGDGSPGIVVAVAPSSVHGALLAHAARRARAAGWLPLVTAARAGTPMCRELAEALGIRVATCRPMVLAGSIAEATRRQRAVLLGPQPAEGSWDFEVLRELALVGTNLVVLVTSEARAWREATRFDVGPGLDREQRSRWLSAAAYETNLRIEASGLDALEASLLDGRWPGMPAADTFGAEPHRTTLTIAALVARSMPIDAFATIGAVASVEWLVRAGHLAKIGELVGLAVSVDGAALEHAATPALRETAAMLLGGLNEPCPWAFARAAELLLTVEGKADAADALVARALELVDDVHASADIRGRWHEAVAKMPTEASCRLRLRAAERALDTGDAHDTQRWCEELLTSSPGHPEALLLVGRALLQQGDLVAARVSLERAANAAKTLRGAEADDFASRVAAAFGEVSYVAGELERAEAHAREAVALARTPGARLEGRNVLGKLHLSAGRWVEAERMFVEDGLIASEAGEPHAELRARLNRAIATLSMDRLDDAATLFERVREDAVAWRVPRARSFALRNLAVVAYRRHDYGRALALWDEEVRVSSALCGRIAMAVTVANFAELRLRLGLGDHAAHTLAFGRRLVTGYVSPHALAKLGTVAARIALARGDLESARRESDAARTNAEASGDRGDLVPDACLVGARVALAEGDVTRALVLVDHAAAVIASDRQRAEVAILRALADRAAGTDALASARDALAAARVADEEDILVEIHALLAQVAREAGDFAESEVHARCALRARDRVADSLPPDIRTAFLAKPENLALARLAAVLDDGAEAELGPSGAATSRSPVDASARALVGDDPAMRRLHVAVRRVARSNSTVLIQGESGTGKELVAEAIHRQSSRASGPFVSVNCSALVDTLLLSELFGHEKGAFTGASARKQGRFELSNGGTLFLDEIGDISPRTQVALLRVLQEKVFERVGGTTPVRVDVRVVCATHRDLRAMVQRGEFREDLYYRIQVVTLEVPALRGRIRDLPSIAQHLLERASADRAGAPRTFTPEALTLLMRYRWPGNVRELENVIRSSALFSEGPAITVTDLVDYVPQLRALAQGIDGMAPPPSILSTAADDSGALPAESEAASEPSTVDSAYSQVRSGAVSLSVLKREIERECIVRALDETHGHITRAAALLGMKRPRLSQLAKQYGLKASTEDSE